MHKKSVGGRPSINPVRISLIEKEERRRTQTLKGRSASISDDTRIPRPRVRSTSADPNNRKSGLKPPARVQHGPYGLATPQASAATPMSSQRGSGIRLQLPPGSTLRGRSPSAERASGIGPKTTRKDNRPLADKAFQAEMLGKIDAYLRAIEKSSIVNSNGSLKPITLKMFVEVSDVLIKLLDVKHTLTTENYVEELPKIAKKLHYPGQINKSWLKTANAMHSWPQVLGWLSWLAESCAVKDLAANHFQLDNLPFSEGENAAGETNKLKLQFLLDAYKAWNEEKPEEEAAATADFLKQVSNARGVDDETLKKARDELDAETLELDKAKETGQQLDEELRQLEEELRILAIKEAKQAARIKELEDAKKKYIKETKMTEDENESLKKTLKKRKSRKAELKAQINSQPMSVAERDTIVDQCVALKNQLRDLNQHLSELEKEVYMLDIKLASASSNLNKVVFAYNKEIYLHLDKAEGVDMADLAMPLAGIPNPDIMEELVRKGNLMAAFHQNMEKQAMSTEATIEALEKDLGALEFERAMLEDDKLERMNEIKKKVKAVRAEAKAEENKLKESIKNLQLGIAEMQERMPDIETEEKEVAEAKEKVEALKRRKAYLEESAKLFFEKFYEILAKHRAKLAKILTEKEEGDE